MKKIRVLKGQRARGPDPSPYAFRVGREMRVDTTKQIAIKTKKCFSSISCKHLTYKHCLNQRGTKGAVPIP